MVNPNFSNEHIPGENNVPDDILHEYLLAAEGGSIAAWDYLADAFENGYGVAKSLEKADFYRQKTFNYYLAKANEGVPSCQASVGFLFEMGIGTEESMESALYYYQQAADQNFPMAWFYLAECYATGKGVPKSIEKAIYYYKLAIDKDVPMAQMCLAQLLLKNQTEESRAVHLLKQVIQKGECDPIILASCEYKLAKCLEEGTGIKKSSQNALNYYLHSAEHGDESAQDRLGNAYLDGELGLAKSPEKAIHFYTLAANQGSSHSLQKLAQCYEFGDGVEQSNEKAFQYYKQAADIGINEGYCSAVYSLAKCYELGIGVEKSLEKAIYYYKLAGENGFLGGYFKVGCCYKKIPGEENAKKALAYFKLSAAENDPKGQHELAQAFEKGSYVEKSQSEADRYYKLAEESTSQICQTAEDKEKLFKHIKKMANKGDPEAQFCLAEYFRIGQGVKQSDKEAFKYHKMAADEGFAPSFIILGSYYYNQFCQQLGKDDSCLLKSIQYYKDALKQAELLVDYYNLDEIKTQLLNWEEELEKLRKRPRVLSYPYHDRSDSKLTKIFKNKSEQRKQPVKLTDQEMFYPGAVQLNISCYFENLDLGILEKIFREAKGTACYLFEDYDFSYEEIIVIRNAMLENPKLTFVGLRLSFYSLWIAFNRAGYGDEFIKRHQMTENPKWHALLFNLI